MKNIGPCSRVLSLRSSLVLFWGLLHFLVFQGESTSVLMEYCCDDRGDWNMPSHVDFGCFCRREGLLSPSEELFSEINDPPSLQRSDKRRRWREKRMRHGLGTPENISLRRHSTWVFKRTVEFIYCWNIFKYSIITSVDCCSRNNHNPRVFCTVSPLGREKLWLSSFWILRHIPQSLSYIYLIFRLTFEFW